MALVHASYHKLQLLEHSPLSHDGFEHPHPTFTPGLGHLCEELRQCPQLQDLSISLPSLCEELLCDPSITWRGEVQIRVAGLCKSSKNKVENQNRFWRILHLARVLIAARNQTADVELDIQLFINHWIFEPRHGRVHGNIETGQALSNGSWPIAYTASCKGPYGQTGLYGKAERPYSCISEEDFAAGLRNGYIAY